MGPMNFCQVNCCWISLALIIAAVKADYYNPLPDSSEQSKEISKLDHYVESVEVDGANDVQKNKDHQPIGATSKEMVKNVTADPMEKTDPTTVGTEIVSQNITTILNTLLQNYDKRLRPNYGGKPVVVFITIYISTISAVSEVEMDYTIDMYLRQYWYDTRLAFSGINESLTVGIDMVKNIWVPDTFFPNEKRSFFHDSTTHNGFLRITPDGQMLRSIRLTVTANCPMNLVYFPMDKQNCSLEIESYGYSTRDIAYIWKGGSAAVDIAPDINLAQFSITGHENYQREISLSTGNYSRLSAHFTLRRNLGFYLIQIYLPSSLIVIISWVSFWLNREATQARVAIGVTTVLTMTTLMTSTNSSMPKVSYVKSIDIYLMTCFVIVFASLLEYAAVGYLLKRVKMRREKAEARKGAIKALPAIMFGNANTAAAAAVGGAVSGPPILPFAPSGQPQSKQSPPLLHPCGHDHCHASYQLQSPGYQSSYDDQPGIGLPWAKRHGYQTIGSPPFDVQTFANPMQQMQHFSHPRSTSEGTIACDCEIETLHLGEDPPPDALYIDRKRRRRFRHRRDKGFRPSSIDKYSRIFFPLSFVVFHVIYWFVYLYTVDL